MRAYSHTINCISTFAPGRSYLRRSYLRLSSLDGPTPDTVTAGVLVAWGPAAIDFFLASLLLRRSLSCKGPKICNLLTIAHPPTSLLRMSSLAIVTFLGELTWPTSGVNSDTSSHSCGHLSLGMSKLGGSYRKCNGRRISQ